MDLPLAPAWSYIQVILVLVSECTFLVVGVTHGLAPSYQSVIQYLVGAEITSKNIDFVKPALKEDVNQLVILIF